MIRLLYTSQSSPSISSEQVLEIQQASQRNNPKVGVTGVLVHGGGLFVQVLEGPEQQVLRQYVKILDDRRHGGCRIVHISPATDRMFQKWSMGVIESDPMDNLHIQQLRVHRLESVSARAFTDVMRAFLDRLKAANKTSSASERK